MLNEEFFDDPVAVVATMEEGGNINPQQVIWQGQKYNIIATGRQWDEADGRHILVETVEGARFELQLRREDFSWQLRRVWRMIGAA